MNLLRIAARVSIATDRSFAESIRDVLVKEIHRQMPGRFDPELYDTNPAGKGFAAGYISFAMKPAEWGAANLIGGVLFRCIYDADAFRSQKPEDGQAEWAGHSGGQHAVELPIEAGYYNKKLGGGLTNPTYLGEVAVFVLQDETVKFESADNMSRGIDTIISNILTDPPAEARKPIRQKPSAVPTSSPQAMLKWLNQQGRNTIFQSEVDLMASQIAKSRGSAQGTVKSQIEQFFQSRGVSIDKNS